jgi:glycosyltransferase involved in cell wall biosynthesis
VSVVGQRIALVTPGFAPRIGGVERHVEALAHGLTRRGLTVEVITADPSGQLLPIEDVDGITVRRFRTIANDGVYVVAPQLGWWLLRNAHRFAVLHAHSYHAPVALQAAIAGYRARRPLVFTPHYHATGHTRVQRALHVPYRLPGRWLVRQARQVVCVSRVEEHLVQRDFGPAVPTRVIPNGVECDEVRAARGNGMLAGQTVVLAVGRLDAYKGMDRLLAALPHLPPEFAIAIVGQGSQRSHLEKLAHELRVHTRLHMLGSLSRTDLLGWFRRADVFVSLSAHEAFGLTVVEAAVAGAPVLASDIPAHRETASYLPDGRVSLVGPGGGPVDVAQAIIATAQRGTLIDTNGWCVPTWGDAANGALACYEDVLNQSELAACAS